MHQYTSHLLVKSWARQHTNLNVRLEKAEHKDDTDQAELLQPRRTAPQPDRMCCCTDVTRLDVGKSILCLTISPEGVYMICKSGTLDWKTCCMNTNILSCNISKNPGTVTCDSI